MAGDLFADILADLGRILKVEGLHPDNHNTCVLKLKTGVRIQLEIDPESKFFVLGSDLGQLPAGKYRENLFREALKTNGLAPPHYGILAYSRQTNALILFERLPLKDLTAAEIASVLEPFIQKAELWHTAIAKGEIPVTAASNRGAAVGMGGLFGLRP
jgi:hypothetical protein